MNQILDFGAGGNNDNNYNNYNKKDKKKEKKEKNNNQPKASLSDKIVKFFAGLMIILAIALIFSGVTSIMKNKEDTTSKVSNSVETPKVEAEILADLDEITGRVKIKVNSSVTISKMIYSWDQDHDNVVSGEKQTSIEESVVAPSGEHVLHIQVIDEQNNKTTKDFTFDSATGMDTTQPEITLTITEDKKLQINVTDDTSVAYVTYTWNDQEAVTMTPESTTNEYQFDLDIPKGKNTIVVVAVDGSESSNAKTTSKVLEGVTKPTIDYGFLDPTGSVLKIMCSHENGIKSIYYTLNGNPYQWEAPEGEEAPKYLEFTQESVQGHNEMTIKVTSVDETTTEFNPVWEYGSAPATEEQQNPENTVSETPSNTTGTDNTVTNTVENNTNTVETTNELVNN